MFRTSADTVLSASSARLRSSSISSGVNPVTEIETLPAAFVFPFVCVSFFIVIRIAVSRTITARQLFFLKKVVQCVFYTPHITPYE